MHNCIVMAYMMQLLAVFGVAVCILSALLCKNVPTVANWC